MKLSKADKVWNRAALELGGSSPYEGDEALAALLLVHGAAMNGGYDDVVDSLNPEEIAMGIQGFQYFGFSEVADLLVRLNNCNDQELELLDRQYGLLIPDDSTLVEAFEKKYLSAPEVFAPL